MTVTALPLRQAAQQVRRGPSERARLGELLALAANGHRRAFMRFYDETVAATYALELRRWEDQELAELLTEARYVVAWDRAAEYPDAGLSPVAWLLSLDLGRRHG